MGAGEAALAGVVEATVKYHSELCVLLTTGRYPAVGRWLAGSLTGAVASQNVTEARKGGFRPDGNRLGRASAETRLTARLTSRAGTKVGASDPTCLSGKAVA